MMKHVTKTVLILLILVLSACGSFQVGLEPVQEPSIVPTTTVPAATSPATTEVVAEPSPEPDGVTPAPMPAPDSLSGLSVAYVREGNVWLWTEGEESDTGGRQLTEDGGVTQVYLSEDATIVAFRRGNGLWLVNSDGSEERQLVDQETFAGMDLGELAGSTTAVAPYQIVWIPGTHTFLFNTVPQLEGLGLALNDDLWLVDADTGEVVQLLDRGQGGNIVISPDGRQVAIVTPGTIDVVSLDAMGLDHSSRTQLLTYAPVVTYSEYAYYAEPVWAPDASSLRVAIPPSDPLAEPPQPTNIWHLYPEGRQPRLIGSLPVEGILALMHVEIAPNLNHVAYLTRVPDEVLSLAIAPLDGEVGAGAIYASSVDGINGWSGDGQVFVYSVFANQTTSRVLGRLGEAPRPLGEEGKVVIDSRWADSGRLVYVQQSGSGWEIVVTAPSAEAEIIATVPGEPPSFDVTR